MTSPIRILACLRIPLTTGPLPANDSARIKKINVNQSNKDGYIKIIIVYGYIVHLSSAMESTKSIPSH